MLFFSSVGHGGVGKIATIGAMASVPYKIFQMSYRIANSPVLSRYYLGVVRNASLGNLAAMSENMEKLDRALLSDEKKELKNDQKK